MRQLIFFCSVTILFLGCVFPIKRSEKSLVPYQENDKLYFLSSDGRLDSIFIKKIEVQRPGGIPDLIDSQSLSVYATSFDSITTIDKQRVKRENTFSIFGVQASHPGQKTEISIGLKGFGFTGSELSVLEFYRKDSVLLGDRILYNVFELENLIAGKYHFEPTNEDDIVKLYWNWDSGIVGYIEENGTYWLLEED